MNAAFCSELFMIFCRCEEKEIIYLLYLGLSRDLNLGPPEWQPCSSTFSLARTEFAKILPRIQNYPTKIPQHYASEVQIFFSVQKFVHLLQKANIFSTNFLKYVKYLFMKKLDRFQTWLVGTWPWSRLISSKYYYSPKDRLSKHLSI